MAEPPRPRPVAALLAVASLVVAGCAPAGSSFNESERAGLKRMLKDCRAQGKHLILDQYEGKHQCLPDTSAQDHQP